MLYLLGQVKWKISKKVIPNFLWKNIINMILSLQFNPPVGHFDLEQFALISKVFKLA